MLDQYLPQCEIFVLYVDGNAVSQAAVMPKDHHTCELKNLATAQAFQRRGFARHLLQWLCGHYQNRYERMIVGTSRQGCSFYIACGFTLFSVVPHFFTDHYTEPIWEQGEQCIDMFYLQRNCKEPWE